MPLNSSISLFPFDVLYCFLACARYTPGLILDYYERGDGVIEFNTRLPYTLKKSKFQTKLNPSGTINFKIRLETSLCGIKKPSDNYKTIHIDQHSTRQFEDVDKVNILAESDKNLHIIEPTLKVKSVSDLWWRTHISKVIV